MSQKKCYIAGKISGLSVEEFMNNFSIAREEVRALGMIPVCPVEINQVNENNHSDTWLNYMRKDIKYLMDCDVIYAQRNSKDSRGAKIEIGLANDIGMEVIYQP